LLSHLDIARSIARAERAVFRQQNLVYRRRRDKKDSAQAEQHLWLLQRSLQQLVDSYLLLDRLGAVRGGGDGTSVRTQQAPQLNRIDSNLIGKAAPRRRAHDVYSRSIAESPCRPGNVSSTSTRGRSSVMAFAAR
jgi:hypothetical protein